MVTEGKETEEPKFTTALCAGDAVGVHTRQEKRWFVAIVSNNSERACKEKLEQRIRTMTDPTRTYDVYVPVRKEKRTRSDGRRHSIICTLIPSMVFIRCTELTRRREIVYLPYIKRFLINSAGSTVHNHRPVAHIPDRQMQALMRMVEDGEDEVTVEAAPLRLGERVRVRSGKLKGIEGNIVCEKDGSTSLVVLIDILGCAKMTISRSRLEAVR